ncbi:unnamed protein product, partial [Mesorhabditis belari]|uniref:Uncharacterized protein n=1 Tax=Mesorhabditis belari TaxID=2138241 RepID=A0AAF3ENI3_9BILA
MAGLPLEMPNLLNSRAMGFLGWVGSNKQLKAAAVGKFWEAHGKQVLMCAAAGVVLLIGIGISVFAGPFIAAVIGGALISAGISGIMTSLSSKTTWESFFEQMAIGAVVGAVSGLFSWGASALIGKFTARGIHWGWKVAISFGTRMTSGITSSVVVKGIVNKLSGRRFFDDWKQAAKTGAIMGLIAFGCDAIGFFNWEQANKVTNDMINKANKSIQSLKDSFNAVTAPWARHTLTTMAELGKAGVENAWIQWITTGKIDWRVVALGVIVYGGMKAARAGYKYATDKGPQKEKNDEQIREVIDDYEHYGEDDQANKNGSVEKPACIGSIRDNKTGNVGKGVNFNARVEKANGNLKKPGDSGFIKNDHRDDLSMGYLVVEGETYKVNGQTVKATGRFMNMTDADASANFGADDYMKQQRGCAEPDMIQKLDMANDCKTPLKHTNLFAFGKTFNKGQGYVGIKPPCDSCKSIPGTTNLSNPSTFRANVQENYFSVDPETHPIYHNLHHSEKNEKTTASAKGENDTPANSGCSNERTNQPQPIYQQSNERSAQSKASTPKSSKDKIKHQAKEKTPDLFQNIEDEVGFVKRAEQELLKEKREAERLEKDDLLRENRPIIRQEEHVYSKSTTNMANTNASESHQDKKRTEYNKERDEQREISEKKPKKSHEPSLKQQSTSLTNGKAEKKKKRVDIFPIISYSEKHNKYMMIEKKDWPKFPEGPTKVIGFTGMRGSGRTTLIHSLLYKAGYALSAEQAISSRLGIGLNMYVLREDGLIFVDVCDSMDSVDEKQNPNSTETASTPLGSYALEIFSYVNCDHLVFSYALDDQCSQSTKQLDDFFHKRTQLLYTSSSFLSRYGAQNITFLLRGNKPNEKTLEKWRELVKLYADEEMDKEGNPEPNEQTVEKWRELVKLHADKEMDKEGNPEPKRNLDEDHHFYMKLLHTVRCFPLQYFQLERSLAGHQQYEEQFENLWKRVIDETSYHMVTLNHNIDDLKDVTVQGRLITTWNEISTSKQINEISTAVANEEYTKKQASGPNPVKTFFENIQHFRSELPSQCSSFSAKVDEFFEKCKEEGERWEKIPPKDRDQSLFFRILLDFAALCIRESLKFDNLSEGIGLGLEGFTLFKETHGGSMDFVLLRYAVFDCDLIGLLSEEIIYMNYSNCWNVLCRLATCGFRVLLLSFPIWAATLRLLEREDELVGDKLRLYK